MTVDTGFSDLVLRFMRLTVVHAVLMFPYITLPPFVLSPLLQAFGRARVRRGLLENPSRGFWKAIWLGVCSPPSRSRNFAEARALLAAGVSPENVVAYLVAAHSFLVYVPLLILASTARSRSSASSWRRS